MIWDLDEEMDRWRYFTTQDVKDIGDYLRALDPYQHPIQYVQWKAELIGRHEDYGRLLGFPHFDATALQHDAENSLSAGRWNRPDSNLSGASGAFDVKWYSPRHGGDLVDGTVRTVQGGGKRSLGEAPRDKNSDWAVLVRRSGSFSRNTDDLRNSPLFTRVRCWLRHSLNWQQSCCRA